MFDVRGDGSARQGSNAPKHRLRRHAEPASSAQMATVPEAEAEADVPAQVRLRPRQMPRVASSAEHVATSEVEAAVRAEPSAQPTRAVLPSDGELLVVSAPAPVPGSSVERGTLAFAASRQ